MPTAMRLQLLLGVGVLVAMFSFASSSSEPSKTPVAECGVPVLSKMSGELISHSTYAKCEFPPNFNCEWNIVSVPGNPSARIEFNFVAYEMPRDQPPCEDTHLKFFSGDSMDKLLCDGRSIPAKFTSSSNKVRIVLKTTSDPKGLTAKGFYLKWKFVRECQPSDFICKNKECIPKGFHCDGGVGLPFKDCSDESDEEGCVQLSSCPNSGDLMCKHKLRCYTKDQECDGRMDCRDGTDENDCLYKTGKSPPCRVNHVWCRTAKKCIRSSMACNGVRDCGGADNSDEENCPDSPEEACDATKFHRCTNNQYIKKDKVCDGKEQCADGSDEKSCSSSG